MAKKIPNVSKWGQDTARERYGAGDVRQPFQSGGEIQAPNTPPTDEPISEGDIKTWGSAKNARAAADARKYAKEHPISADEEKELTSQMGRKRGGRK